MNEFFIISYCRGFDKKRLIQMITFIAKFLRPNSCAFFAILQNEMPWAPASFNFSDILRATSSSSIQEKQLLIGLIVKFLRKNDCILMGDCILSFNVKCWITYFYRELLCGMPSAPIFLIQAIWDASLFEWPNHNAYGILNDLAPHVA